MKQVTRYHTRIGANPAASHLRTSSHSAGLRTFPQEKTHLFPHGCPPYLRGEYCLAISYLAPFDGGVYL